MDSVAKSVICRQSSAAQTLSLQRKTTPRQFYLTTSQGGLMHVMDFWGPKMRDQVTLR